MVTSLPDQGEVGNAQTAGLERASDEAAKESSQAGHEPFQEPSDAQEQSADRVQQSS
jgi:hypothetical protein